MEWAWLNWGACTGIAMVRFAILDQGDRDANGTGQLGHDVQY